MDDLSLDDALLDEGDLDDALYELNDIGLPLRIAAFDREADFAQQPAPSVAVVIGCQQRPGSD